jgi:uncharacterized membrane protein YraQ (UPF0718 family)
MPGGVGDEIATGDSSTAHAHDRHGGRGIDPALAVVAAVVLLAALARPLLTQLLDEPAVAHWATIFVAITVQALPFLVLGIAISSAIAALVPPGFLPRMLPARPGLAVPVAAVAGGALPGCECGSVPIARRLVTRGVAPAAALTFLLSSPAVNPIVLVSTSVAFPGQPSVVVARLAASLLAATGVGLIWARFAPGNLLRPSRRDHDHDSGGRLAVLGATAQHDLLQAGGFLIVGAATAATLQTAVPRSALDAVGGSGLVAVLVLAGLAVVMAICSEADAFVAASLTQFSLTSRLAFMVVGPMVDVKLIALQTGTFGRRFAMRFAPLTFIVAVSSSLLVGWWLL